MKKTIEYVSKPTEVEAMQWNGHEWDTDYDHFDGYNSILEWVNANGGEARYEPGKDYGGTGEYPGGPTPARIALRTTNGWAYAAPGDYVVMGSTEFEVPEWSEILNAQSSYELRDFYPHYPGDVRAALGD